MMRAIAVMATIMSVGIIGMLKRRLIPNRLMALTDNMTVRSCTDRRFGDEVSFTMK